MQVIHNLLKFLIYLAIIALPLAHDAQSKKDKKNSLKQLWQQKKHDLKLLEKKGEHLLDLLGMLDRKRLALIVRREKLYNKIKQLQHQLNKNEIQLRIQRSIAKTMRSKMTPRLRLFYRIARLGHARLLLGTRTLKELTLRWSALRLLMVRELKIFKSYQKIRHQIQDNLKTLKKRQKTLHQLLLKLKKEEKKLLITRQRKKNMLEKIYKKANLFRRALRELRASHSELRRLSSSDIFLSKNTKSFEEFKHLLPWPIRNYSPYCQRYETKWVGSFAALSCKKWGLQPQPLRGKLGRVGITLLVPERTPVIAIASGKIVHQGWLRGYGKLMLIDHGHRYYSLYAHLSRFGPAIGEFVRQGQVIALSGSTGILGRPGLYFEIRHKALPLKPENWLKLPSPPEH